MKSKTFIDRPLLSIVINVMVMALGIIALAVPFTRMYYRDTAAPGFVPA